MTFAVTDGTALRDPGTGAALIVQQHAGLMHVNRPDCRAAVTPAPGARRGFAFGVDVTTAG